MAEEAIGRGFGPPRLVGSQASPCLNFRGGSPFRSVPASTGPIRRKQPAPRTAHASTACVAGRSERVYRVFGLRRLANHNPQKHYTGPCNRVMGTCPRHGMLTPDARCFQNLPVILFGGPRWARAYSRNPIAASTDLRAQPAAIKRATQHRRNQRFDDRSQKGTYSGSCIAESGGRTRRRPLRGQQARAG